MMTSIEKHPLPAAASARPSAVVVERHRKAVVNLLAAEGFDIFVAPDGRVALELALMRQPALLILDVELPGLDGPEVCRRLRGHGMAGAAPAIVILSDQADEAVKVHALEAGADDYVTTPFGERELVARIRSAVRRHVGSARPPGGGLRHGEIWMDPERHEARYRSQPLDFTPTEFDIVKLLLSDPGRTFTRGQIGQAIRDGFAQAADRTIDCHVKGIRRKLGDGAAVIQTVRGVGYRLRAAAAPGTTQR
jgi:DNA-binding response OmpR family regulator